MDAARARFERVGVAESPRSALQPMLLAAVLGVGGLISVCLPQKPATGGEGAFYGVLMLVASAWLFVREYLKRRQRAARKTKTPG